VERNSGAWAGRQSFRHDTRNSGTVVWQGDLTRPGGHGAWMWRRRVDGTSSNRGPVQDEGAVIMVGTVPCRMPPGDRL
jgi:hypothetical protein